MPSTEINPAQCQRADYSPSFAVMNAQVIKGFGKNNVFDAYIGAENLTNFYQHDAIIATGEPFGDYFDTSLIWGSVTGRMFYGGLRFSIK